MAYNKDKDYQALIDQAVAKGNYKAAAQYEQARNEKINDLNASGTNQWNATATNKYAGWLDDTDYGTIGKQQMAAGASAEDVLDTYNSRYNKAATTEGMTQYANDDLQKEMWAYITENLNKPDASFDFSTQKPTYNSSYSDRIDQLLNEILTREDFRYDAAKDPLYSQYQSQYQREGSRAMNDTLAEMASGAGGMNSYAVTAAQQANDYYAAQAADKIPELYQLAYEMYLNDKAGQVENLGLLQQMDNTQYNRYRDTMSDWRNDRDFAYNQYRDQVGDWQWDKNFDYNAGRDDLSDQRYQQEWDYNVGRDQISDDRYNKEWEYGVEHDKLDREDAAKSDAHDWAMKLLNMGIMPEAEQLATAGISAEQAQKILNALGYWTYGTGGYTGGGTGGYTGGYVTSGGSGATQEGSGTKKTSSKVDRIVRDVRFAGGLTDAMYSQLKSQAKKGLITEDELNAVLDRLEG